MKKSFLAVLLVAAVVFVTAAAAGHGRGHGHGRTLLRQHLVGSILTDPLIHAVTRGGAPWVGTADARLDTSGRFQARVRGLVIPTLGNAGAVNRVTFSLYCAPETSGAVFTTDPVPLSPDGNARVRQDVTVPARCLAPVLLIHPNENNAVYIAATGFMTG